MIVCFEFCVSICGHVMMIKDDDVADDDSNIKNDDYGGMAVITTV